MDASPEVMPQGMMGEIMHMTDDGRGQLVNMKGFENVMDMAVNSAFTMPSGTFKCIGTARDVEGSSLVYFLCDTVGTAHSIMAMNTDTKALSWILRDEPLLNFKAAYRVSANVIEGLLYWTDGYFGSFLGSDYNPPHKVNMAKAARYTEKKYDGKAFTFYKVAEAASLTGNASYLNYTAYVGSSSWDSSLFGSLKVVAFALDGINRYKNSSGYGRIIYNYIDSGTYIIVTNRPWQDSTTVEKDIAGTLMTYEPGTYFGIDWQVMDRVKYPPAYAPTAEYFSDTEIESNSLRDSLFQFAYRYVYDDNEKSVFSPKSNVPLPTVLSLLNGGTLSSSTTDNAISVWMDWGPLEVRGIELVVREGNTGDWRLIHRKQRYSQAGDVLDGQTSDIYVRYDFYNTELGEFIDNVDVARPYDAVPIVSAHQEIIEKNRIVDADIVESYDNIDIDVELTNVQSSPIVGKIGGITEDWTQKLIAPTTPMGGWYYAGVIDMASFYEPGYTYVFYIDAYPHAYDYPYGPISQSLISTAYGEYAGKSIMAQAIVEAPSGMSFNDFSDVVVASLRNGNSMDSSVIAMNRSQYSSFNNLGPFQSIETGFPVFPPTNTIGFIIHLAPENPPACVYCPDVNVRVVKTSNFSTETTFKSGANQPFGVFYLDRASRFNAVNKSANSEIYIPPQNAQTGSHELYKNEVRWTINHIPPDWAVYYVWAYAKNSTIANSLYATISKIEKINATNSLFLAVNQYIVDQHESIKKFNIPTYTWEPGDRVRFIANRSGSYYYTINEPLDIS